MILLLSGETKTEVSKAIEFFKKTLVQPEFDWCKARAVMREFEYATFGTISPDDISSFHIIAAYDALFKGFGNIFKRLVNLIGLDIQDEKMEWAQPIYNKMAGFNKLIPPEPYITLRTSGCNMINNIFLGMPFDKELMYGPVMKLSEYESSKISLQTMLQFQNVTLFSPSGDSDKYILF